MRFEIGTTPILLLNSNPNRTFWSVTFLPTDIETGNTGRVHIGKGYQPVATVGSPAQGEILLQGGETGDEAKFENDTSVFKGAVWATASTSGQIVEVNEAIMDKKVTPQAQ